jgi:hypothetical protein
VYVDVEPGFSYFKFNSERLKISLSREQHIFYVFVIFNIQISGRSTTGMASMMDEMAKTLARRRQTLAQAEKKEVIINMVLNCMKSITIQLFFRRN